MKLEYNIPSIDRIRLVSNLYQFRRFFLGVGFRDRIAQALVTNFIRLVDLSISEYELGRRSIMHFSLSEGKLELGSVIRASNHFEVCIVSVKRSIDHLKAIRAHPKVPQKLKNDLPKNTQVLSGAIESQISKLRHRIQHLEKDLLKGEISEGQTILIALEKDKIELGDLFISYSDLAKWIQELYRFSIKISQFRES